VTRRLSLEEVAPLIESVRGHAVGINFVLEWPQDERLERALEAGARVVSFCWVDLAPLVARAHEAAVVAAIDPWRDPPPRPARRSGRSYEQLWYGLRAAIKWCAVGSRVTLVRRAGIGLFLVRQDAP
jgi:hypothetical protein